MKYPENSIKPQIVFDKYDLSDLQSKIDELDAEFKVREIQVTFNQDAYFFGLQKNLHYIISFKQI